MNNLPERFSLGEQTRKIISLRDNMSQNVIEMGKILINVRNNIPRGEWMDWLRNEVYIPYTAAFRFMRVAKEINDADVIKRVGFRKVVDILELPASKMREELLELAPSLTRQDIQDIKDDISYSQGISKPLEGVVVEPEVDLTDVDTALDANAILLDALFRIDVSQLPSNYRDLLVNQLRKTPSRILEFIGEVSKNG